MYAVSQQTYIDQHLNLDISLIDLVGGLLIDLSIILTHPWLWRNRKKFALQTVNLSSASRLHILNLDSIVKLDMNYEVSMFILSQLIGNGNFINPGIVLSCNESRQAVFSKPVPNVLPRILEKISCRCHIYGLPLQTRMESFLKYDLTAEQFKTNKLINSNKSNNLKQLCSIRELEGYDISGLINIIKGINKLITLVF